MTVTTDCVGPITVVIYSIRFHIVWIYYGITSGRVLSRELLYTEILENNSYVFTYTLFHEEFSPIYEALYV